MKAKTMVYLEREQLTALKARARAQRISLAEVVRRVVQASLDADPSAPPMSADVFQTVIGLGASGRTDIGDRHDSELAKALRKRRHVR